MRMLVVNERNLFDDCPLHRKGHYLHVPWKKNYTNPQEYPQCPQEALKVVHIDQHILVVDKPAYLPVENTQHIKDSVVSRCRRLYEPIHHVAHRLDWETSGLLVLARTVEAHKSLSRQFEKREVAKQYVADLEVPPPASNGEIHLPLVPDIANPPLQCIDLEGGKPSVTAWRSLGGCRVELEPLSGRRHQLRLHMLAIGCPIVGDSLYSSNYNKFSRRLHLHAIRISFVHPANGGKVQLESAPPFAPLHGETLSM